MSGSNNNDHQHQHYSCDDDNRVIVIDDKGDNLDEREWMSLSVAVTTNVAKANNVKETTCNHLCYLHYSLHSTWNIKIKVKASLLKGKVF